MSDSEYSVNDSQQNVNAAPQSCHSTFIDEFQGAVFYRRPIAFVALIVSVNLMFLLYRKLNLNFYCLICLFGIIYIGTQLIPSAIYSTVKSVLFPGQLNKGDLNDPSRVRDTNELVAPINKFLSPVFGFVQIVNTLSQDQSVTGLLIYGSIFFCLFCITASVDFFWPIVILTNFALILPGVLTRPQVIPYVQKAREHITARSEENAQSNNNAPNLNNLANQVNDAVNNAVDDVKQKVDEVQAQVNDE